MEQTTNKKFDRLMQSDMPRSTLKSAYELAQVLKDNFAGKNARPIDLANALNWSPSSSGWRMLTGAVVAYGLTDNAYNAQSISLTSLGQQIVSPTAEGDDKRGLLTALLRPTIAKAFYEKYDNAKFPKEDIAKNVLNQLGVPHDRTDEALKIITENAKFVGVLTNAGGGQYIQLNSVSVPIQETKEIPLAPTGTVETKMLTHETNRVAISGHSTVSVAEGRMFLSVPTDLKDKLIDDDVVATDWALVRKALKEFADKHLPKG
jgi:hypothetical protein